mmetsp:Transcript_51305/g.160209  ORF Transcript_51305/g.160209 Transcript_51305/m.160209 type:complete len:274 (+) Transcript_51305:250-1071(+)
MDISLNQRFIVYGDDIGNFYKIDKYKTDNYCFNRISTSDEIFNLVRFSKNSDLLASSTFSGKIFLWSINNSILHKNFATDNNLTSDIEFCEKDPIFFSCGENSLVYMWNCDRDYYIHMFKGHSKRINCINIHPSQDYFATCSYDKTIKFWDKRISKPVGNIILENLVIKSIKFTKDGNFLCFPDSSGQINFWDIRKDKNLNRISNIKKKKNISHLEFNKFGNFLFYCIQDSNIIINSYSNGKYHSIGKDIRVNNELLVLKYLNYNTLFLASYT